MYTYYSTLKRVPLSSRSRGLSSELPRSLEYLGHIPAHSQLTERIIQGDEDLQLIAAEDLCHVLVQPVDLVARCKDKILHFLVTKAIDILLFL